MMSLLKSLFPGLTAYDESEIPLWEDLQRPWSILGRGSLGLISQIVEITGAEDGVLIDESAVIGEFVKIEGPCIIGPNAIIKHSAFLRPGSWICEGAVVGHSSEIKNSVLLPNSKAPHFNYVGDSILGIGANLGAGAKLSNVRNDRREVFVTLSDGERFGSGLRKFGAILGDNCQLGCNVVTNPGTIMTPGSMIEPNKTVGGWVGVKS